MTCTAALANETVWFDKYKCEDAEQQYYERIHKLQWIKSSSEVTPKTSAVAPKMEEKAQVKLEPAAAKPAPVPPTAAPPSPVVAQPSLIPTAAPQVPPVAIPPASVPPVVAQPIIQPPVEAISKGEEKDNAEKEVEVKKSKKSKKNKNKKNQQSAEMKGAAQPPQQQPAEAKKAPTPIEGKEPQKKAEAKKEPQQQKAEVKKEQPQQQPPKEKVEAKKEQQQQQQQQPPPPPQQQQQKETKKEQAPPHEGKKGKKDKEAKKGNQGSSAGKGSLVDEIARARQHITNSLHCDGASLAGGDAADILARLAKLEVENKQLSKVRDDVKNLTALLSKLTLRLEVLEKSPKGSGEPTPAPPAARPKAPAQKKPPPKEEDDDVDLFGSDDEDDAEKERVKAERLKMYEEKKSKKPVLIAKSNIILDVKPWDDETDMKAMEAKVREVACDGLLWGASKLVPLAYGIHKLQISCVIEDEKVSVDWLQETIEANEDFVQSVDVAAFNKV